MKVSLCCTAVFLKIPTFYPPFNHLQSSQRCTWNFRAVMLLLERCIWKIRRKVKNILEDSLYHQWKINLWAGKLGWGGKAKHCWALSTICFVDSAQQCLAKEIKTTDANVHDSLKVMGSNPGYLLKSSLLYTHISVQ